MAIREYRSNVFSMLLEDKENALQVYNALNDSNYTDCSDIYICRLENSIMISVRNDASFLKDFLRKRRNEVLEVMTIDMTWESREKIIRREEREEGREEGRKEGREEGREEVSTVLNNLYSLLLEQNRIDDLKKATKDKEYREKLLKEMLNI